MSITVKGEGLGMKTHKTGDNLKNKKNIVHEMEDKAKRRRFQLQNMRTDAPKRTKNNSGTILN